MAKDHGRLDNKVADLAVHPVVDIGSADAGVFDVDEDIVRGSEGGNRSVFVLYMAGFLENEGWVLGRNVSCAYLTLMSCRVGAYLLAHGYLLFLRDR